MLVILLILFYVKLMDKQVFTFQNKRVEKKLNKENNPFTQNSGIQTNSLTNKLVPKFIKNEKKNIDIEKRKKII